MEEYFSNKLVVITGGTSGIGLALAQELFRREAKVVVLADQVERLEDVAKQFGGRNPRFGAYVCDIGVPADVAAASRQVIADYGPPDILVNNAGFATYRTFEQEFPDEMERLYNVNFGGALRVTKAFLQGMIKRSSGHIVNIASIAGAMTITPNAVYGGAKHGMMAWSKCIAIELARFGVNVHVICPGRVETSFFDHETFRMRAHRKETELTIPIEEVVQAIIDTILHNKAVRFVPRYYGLLAWALHAFGPLVQGPMDRLLRARIEDLYRNRDKQ